MILQGLIVLSILLGLTVAMCYQFRQNISEIEKSEIEDKLRKRESENAQLVDIIENRCVNVEFKILGDWEENK